MFMEVILGCHFAKLNYSGLFKWFTQISIFNTVH